MKRLHAILPLALMLAGCAAPQLTDRAASVQVHSQMSTLLASCQKLGPVRAVAHKYSLPSIVQQQAENDARDQVARLGGDTLVITNTDHSQDLSGHTYDVHGVALRCY